MTVVRDYSWVHDANNILTMVVTRDDRWLKSGDDQGYLKQISISARRLEHDFGRVVQTPSPYWTKSILGLGV
jgi:hypothetical protein